MAALGRRLAALRRLCRRGKVDAILLSNPYSVRYFSGFTGEDSCLLAGPRWVRLLTDGRFEQQARLECPRVKTVIRGVKMLEAIAGVMAEKKPRRLGVEGNHLSVTRKAELDRALPHVRVKPFSGEVEALREAKDVAEVAAIRKAVRAAERAFKDLIGGGARKLVGRTEMQVAAELDYLMRQRGAERPAFQTIVAAGRHAAMPHYRPRSTKIRRGDPVLIDWGAVVGGYCADLTRVLFTGRIRPQIARMYETVLRAQAVAARALRPGAACSSVDAAARKLIRQAGYGEALRHGLGHGLGLEVHESPRLGPRARRPLRAGMVVTVEPGIYLPGVGGVRIEDDVLLVPGGRRRLSKLSRHMQAMRLR